MDVWGENYLRPLKRSKKDGYGVRPKRGPWTFAGVGVSSSGIPRKRSYCLCCHLNDLKKEKPFFQWSLFLYLFLSLGLASKKWSQFAPRFSRKSLFRYLFLLFPPLNAAGESKQSRDWTKHDRDPRIYPVLTCVEQHLTNQAMQQQQGANMETNISCRKHRKKVLSIHSQWLSDARVLRYLDAYKDPQKAAEKLVETWEWRCSLPNTNNLLKKLHYYVAIGDFSFVGEDQHGYPVVYIHCNSDKFDLEFLSCILETLDTYLDEKGAYAGSWVWILDWRKRQPTNKDSELGVENTKMGSFLDAVKICTKHFPGRLKKAYVIGAHGPLLTLFHMFAHRETKKKVVFLQQVNSSFPEIEQLVNRSHQTEAFHKALADAGFLCSCKNASYSDVAPDAEKQTRNNLGWMKKTSWIVFMIILLLTLGFIFIVAIQWLGMSF
jgi:hypothetical protein